MQESQPPINLREQKKDMARKAGDKFMKKYTGGNEDLWERVIEFTKNLRKNHGDFILLHYLIGSSMTSEDEDSMPLDTPDGQIEKFIREELAKLG